jgi:amidase
MAMHHADLHRHTVRDLIGMVQARATSVETVVTAFLARSADCDAAIGAWAAMDTERALDEARAVDRRPNPGPLAGLVLGVKDLFDTADLPTAYGSAAFAGNRPRADAAIVASARQAGAVVLGKTVTTEFALMAPPTTRHPLNPLRTPGGSSSGSAAAVATSMIGIGLGTQTAGSVIRPAAFCGVTGFKPSFGLFSRGGLKVVSDSLDTVGLLGRDVADVALVASVLAETPALAGPVPNGPELRIGIFRTATPERADGAATQALEWARTAAAAFGAQLHETETPSWWDRLLLAQDIVMRREVSQALLYERLHMAERLQPATLFWLAQAATVGADAYAAALAFGRTARRLGDELFAGNDVLVTFASCGEAPGCDSTGDAVFNRAWTLLRLPCVTIPAGTGPAGLPVGIQVVGPRGNDAAVLAAAAFLQGAMRA